MRLKLRLSPSLNDKVGNRLEYELIGTTIHECLGKIKHLFPEVAAKVWKDDRLNPQILLFHNNTIIRETDFSNIVCNNDVLDIIPAIEGG